MCWFHSKFTVWWYILSFEQYGGAVLPGMCTKKALVYGSSSPPLFLIKLFFISAPSFSVSSSSIPVSYISLLLLTIVFFLPLFRHLFSHHVRHPATTTHTSSTLRNTMAPNSSDDKLTDFCSPPTAIACNIIVNYNKCQLGYLLASSPGLIFRYATKRTVVRPSVRFFRYR